MSRTICTESTVRMTPRDLASNQELFQVMMVHGISTEHIVYMHIDRPGEYYYLSFPDGGEVSALGRWANTETDVRKWEAATVDRTTAKGRQQDAENLVSTWQSVSSTVLEICTKEIADEMDVSL